MPCRSRCVYRCAGLDGVVIRRGPRRRSRTVASAMARNVTPSDKTLDEAAVPWVRSECLDRVRFATLAPLPACLPLALEGEQNLPPRCRTCRAGAWRRYKDQRVQKIPDSDVRSRVETRCEHPNFLRLLYVSCDRFPTRLNVPISATTCCQVFVFSKVVRSWCRRVPRSWSSLARHRLSSRASYRLSCWAPCTSSSRASRSPRKVIAAAGYEHRRSRRRQGRPGGLPQSG